MGGNYGDCATYRGRVISVPETGGTASVFTVDAAAGDNQGAIWMGGAAPVVDSTGNVWVSAGNGSVYSASEPYDDSDSVLELSPSMTLEQYFAPSNWPANNAGDLDMSDAPALLPDGQVVLAGKSRIVYLLNGSALGGIGGQEAALPAACSEDIDGGVAIEGTTVFLPCFAGPIAVQASTSPPALHLLWRSPAGGGPPIVAGGLVWTIGQNGVLYGLNPTSGNVRAAGHHRSPGQPLPDSLRGRRFAPGHLGHPRRGLRRALCRVRPIHHDDDDLAVYDHHGAAGNDDHGRGAKQPHDGGRRRDRGGLAGRHRHGGLARGASEALPSASRRPRPCTARTVPASAGRQQHLEHGAHAGHHQRDGEDHRRDLYERPVHGLPVAHVVELVEQSLRGVGPTGLLGARSSSGRGSRVAT